MRTGCMDKDLQGRDSSPEYDGNCNAGRARYVCSERIECAQDAWIKTCNAGSGLIAPEYDGNCNADRARYVCSERIECAQDAWIKTSRVGTHPRNMTATAMQSRSLCVQRADRMRTGCMDKDLQGRDSSPEYDGNCNAARSLCVQRADRARSFLRGSVHFGSTIAIMGFTLKTGPAFGVRPSRRKSSGEIAIPTPTLQIIGSLWSHLSTHWSRLGAHRPKWTFGTLGLLAGHDFGKILFLGYIRLHPFANQSFASAESAYRLSMLHSGALCARTEPLIGDVLLLRHPTVSVLPVGMLRQDDSSVYLRTWERLDSKQDARNIASGMLVQRFRE